MPHAHQERREGQARDWRGRAPVGATAFVLAAVASMLVVMQGGRLPPPFSITRTSQAAATTKFHVRMRITEVTSGGVEPAPLEARGEASKAAWRRRRHSTSFYKKWVEADFDMWRQSGITREMVTRAAVAKTFQIVDGVLWADHPPAARDNAWASGPDGLGWISGKSRIPHTLLMLADLLRSRPGEVPDVDAVWHQEDMPLFFRANGSNWADWWPKGAPPRRQGRKPPLPPPPILAYAGHAAFTDIPVPDFTWLGHERDHLTAADGGWLWGWDTQRESLVQKWAGVPLTERKPELVWRGRVAPQARDALRRAFAGCPARLNASAPADAALFNLWRPAYVAMHDACRWRFIAYLESQAYSSSLKQRLACGSVLVAPKPRFYEFWTRALQPGVHYVEVSDDPERMCAEVAAALRAMNARLDGAAGGGAEAAVRDDDPGGETSGLKPDEIARNGQLFLQQHMRLEDAREQLLAVLREYAGLQRFRPKRHKRARCITGDHILDEFSSPHKKDAELVARHYPWLPGWDPGCSMR
eukprot:scaffold14.g1327.t1